MVAQVEELINPEQLRPDRSALLPELPMVLLELQVLWLGLTLVRPGTVRRATWLLGVVS